MIARVWTARTTGENAAVYAKHFQSAVLPHLRGIRGYAGATVLQSDSHDVVEIIVTTRWMSIDAIRDFAGEPIDRAVVDDETRPLLVSFDERVRHFAVAFEDGPI